MQCCRFLPLIRWPTAPSAQRAAVVAAACLVRRTAPPVSLCAPRRQSLAGCVCFSVPTARAGRGHLGTEAIELLDLAAGGGWPYSSGISRSRSAGRGGHVSGISREIKVCCRASSHGRPGGAEASDRAARPAAGPRRNTRSLESNSRVSLARWSDSSIRTITFSGFMICQRAPRLSWWCFSGGITHL